MLKKLSNLVFGILLISTVFGQSTKSWVNPVDIPLKLAGTFGELRSDHFHSGIDIKTGEREGLSVRAIDTGYVSRIKIQSSGYGKALYIKHPNGETSVYAHLQKFNSRLNAYVTAEQYRQQSFETDLYPKPGKFRVSRGELIAYSGSTGHTAGPHLHFEVRDELQQPLNPLLLGFKVTDNRAPTINYLKVYPANPHSSVNGKTEAVGFYTSQQKNSFHLKSVDTLTISGAAYFGINTIDLFNGGMNKNGVYAVRLSCNGQTRYAHKLSKIDFNETRYINALIDYKEYKTLKRRVQYAWVQPNNHLSIYDSVQNKGIINFKAGKVYQLEFAVSDAAGNSSKLEFIVKGSPRDKSIKVPKHSGSLFTYKKDNHFSNGEVDFEIPGKALYDTLYFQYNRKPSLPGSYSALHMLHHDYVPLQSWCKLSIKADSLPDNLRSKALIANYTADHDFESAGGEWDHGFVRTEIRSFGDYCILVDTIAPKIIPVNIKNGKSLLAQSTIKVKITDELSGIKKYEGRLNGKWILMAYDEKKDLLIYDFDSLLTSGENNFKLTVWDQVGNTADYEAVLEY